MLSKLMAMTKAELKSKIQSIDAALVKGRALRRQLTGMQKKQGGFTLLELLVVVAILAAIAGTATVMLQDTDRKAAAGAHVAMMDGLAKGILTFQKMNGNLFPDNWDSLETVAAGNTLVSASKSTLLADALGDMLADYTLADAAQVTALNDAGLTKLRVLDSSAAAPCGSTATIRTGFTDKSGKVPQNIFRTVANGGCGGATDAAITGTTSVVQRWLAAQNPRVNAGANDVLVAVGAGPDATLFNPANIGALSNVPVYRHVTSVEYNRFIVLWNIGTEAAPAGKATLQAIVDGAGDTKDEELGEVDNIRAT